MRDLDLDAVFHSVLDRVEQEGAFRETVHLARERQIDLDVRLQPSGSG